MEIRPARSEDEQAIRELIHRVNINPMGLDWHRFLVIEDENGYLIACGQVKPHKDGSRELASIAVDENFRGQGYARQIIERLMTENPPPLYLTCRQTKRGMYEKFDFRSLTYKEMTPYFRRLYGFAKFISWLVRRLGEMNVMKWG
jgi:GNAT superfamily N-acetyltransferase